MSRLINGTTSQGPIIDPRISPHIHLVTTVEIPTEICVALHRVFVAVADALQCENRSVGNSAINCIFSDEDRFSIEVDPAEYAVCMRIAFYPLSRLMPHIGTDKLYTILTEELCHLIWDISDEVEVNFKVLSVLRHLNPELQMSDLYSEEAVQSCSRWLQDHPAFQP